MITVDALNANSSSPGNDTLVGWVLESPGRGTLSLITSCLFTTILCTWAVIHPRVTRERQRRICHKLALFLKTIIAPEFIAVESLQEWSQARKTIKNCEHLTLGELELVQAFYIGMLALRYRTERGEKVIWPNQYQWLLEQRLIDWKDHEPWGLSQESIRDKSNADIPVKAFAVLQVSWFVAQSIMRSAHDLPLSQLESMTLGYVPLFVVTSYFWWMKPKDVLTPSVVDLPNMSIEQKTAFENMSVDSTFDYEHTKEQDSWLNIWKLTPRVFEKEARDKALEEVAHHTISGTNQQSKLHSENLMTPKRPEDAPPLGHTILKKAATEKLSLKRTLTELKPSLRKAFTENLHSDESQTVAIQMTDISHEPRFLENTFRRLTLNLRTSRTTGLAGTPLQKKDRVLPQYPSEIVLAYWDPHVYHSKIWPITCLFGASFGALHLISWNTVFPTLVESWLWRAASITSIVSMLIFMQYEKVVLKWGGPLTLLSIVSPVIYLISRIVMIGEVIAAFRAMDPKIYQTYVVSTYWVHLV